MASGSTRMRLVESTLRGRTYRFDLLAGWRGRNPDSLLTKITSGRFVLVNASVSRAALNAIANSYHRW